MMEDVHFDQVEGRGPNESFGGSAQSSVPGGCAPLFWDHALARALHESLLDESPYPSDTTEAHRSVLRALLDRADGLVKREFVPDEGALARLAVLGTSSANATRAMEVVYHAAGLARATGSPLRVPPILLHGPPGSGKTRVARAIVEALALPFEVVSGATMADAGELCGRGLSWRNPGMGTIARALVAAPTLAVAVVLDEVDKVGSYIHGQDTRDGLLPLLEPTTAARWTDDWLGAEMRADGLVWMMTCNDLQPLSAPFRDRCLVVEVPALDGSGREAALANIMADLARESRFLPHELPAGTIAELDGVSLRRVRIVLRVALGVAATGGRESVDIGDVRAALAIVGPDADRRAVGFVR